MICPFYQPWTTTSTGERNHVCVCNELRIIKYCDNCINIDSEQYDDYLGIRELALKKLKL